MNIIDILMSAVTVGLIIGGVFIVWISEKEIDRIKKEQLKSITDQKAQDAFLGFDDCRLGITPRQNRSPEYYEAYGERYAYEQAVSEKSIN